MKKHQPLEPPVCERCWSTMIVTSAEWTDDPNGYDEQGPICPVCDPEAFDAYFAWLDKVANAALPSLHPSSPPHLSRPP